MSYIRFYRYYLTIRCNQENSCIMYNKYKSCLP